MPSDAPKTTPETHACTELLSGYAARGFFTGFSVEKETATQASYQLHWHFNRLYQLDINLKTGKIEMPAVFPGVKPRSHMDKDFRAFIAGQSLDDQPEHRRFDEGQLKVVNRKGNLSLTMYMTGKPNAQNPAQATSRFITLIHEAFKVFLKNGHYDIYVSEQYQIDTDSFW